MAREAIMPGTGGSMVTRNAALAFSFGVVAAHWLPAAASLWACWMCAGVAIALARRLRVFGAALVGLGWGAVHGLDALDRRIDPGCAQASVTGRIVGLPSEQHGRGTIARRFVFEPEAASCELRGPLRLMWLDGPSLRSAERWSLGVRLKSPRAGANTHGFDAEAWFVRDKLAATGYVVHGRRLDASASVAGIHPVSAVRQELRDDLARLALVHGGVLAALTLGDKEAIPRHKVDLYRRTGTMHLLVISGLHVGVVTALGFLAGRAVGTVTTLPLRATGVVSALVLSSAYVAIAGGGLSLVRAFAMSLAGMVALLAGRSSAPSAAFAFALAVVLVIDPMAPLSSGFWLSFGAVAVLLGFFVPRPRRRSWLISAVVAQLAIATVFVPATTAITGLVHPLGIGVNLVAVPAVTLLLVPLALSGVALIGTPIGPWLLTAADFVVHVLETVLSWADRIAPIYVASPDGWLAWVVVAAAVGLTPTSRLARALLVSTAAMILLLPRPALPWGHLDVTVLDVGQGTAVLVETANHTLVYDTGPIFPSGRDTGAGVVLPAARGRGWPRIDRLVLSHGDVDHVGGAASVLAGMRVGEVLAGESVPGIEAQPCHAGSDWHWDGVAFSVLSPTADHRFTGNNASCVVLIETASHRVLLTGDIEANVEYRLELPTVDVLLVPHHGSATSSTSALVAATQPKFAIVAAGFDNHFGHPHPRVVARYRNAGSHIVSTGVAGAVRWRSTHAMSVTVQRCAESPYWRSASAGPRGTAVRCEWRAMHH
ncbi:MAG: DNA internalization-related competence protein ComEC/Rec2 [Gammaproteobacteria bacterium]|nr:DNA internalization-related competence protein ComEC/Rec2 [Gammaproteobacteria bacterium]